MPLFPHKSFFTRILPPSHIPSPSHPSIQQTGSKAVQFAPYVASGGYDPLGGWNRTQFEAVRAPPLTLPPLLPNRAKF